MPDLSQHRVVRAGGAAVITGGASGIGLAAAKAWAQLGLAVELADLSMGALSQAIDDIRAEVADARVTATVVDVSKPADVQGFANAVAGRHDRIAVLMNNAGVGSGGDALTERGAWDRVLGVNFYGVLNGVQAFAPLMTPQAEPSLIVNTGSKQGITTPPDDTAYNVSKAAVKVLTEGLAHTLRATDGCQVSAHLFVPGFVFTGLTRQRGVTEKPAGAWTPEETVAYLFERLGAGDFYVICPDNETTSAMDRKRIAWAAGDVIENRPALSRWHADFKDAFAAHMRADDG